MTHDEIIAVVQAHKNGKQIQCKARNTAIWGDAGCPNWAFHNTDYRVKPEPREFILPLDANGNIATEGQHGAIGVIQAAEVIKVREVLE